MTTLLHREDRGEVGLLGSENTGLASSCERRRFDAAFFCCAVSALIVLLPALFTFAVRSSPANTQLRPTAVRGPSAADVLIDAWVSRKWIECIEVSAPKKMMDNAAQTVAAARAQGLDTLPITDGVDDLSTSVSVVFARAAPYGGRACGKDFCIDPGMFEMSGAAPDEQIQGTTAQTALHAGLQPIVTWPCHRDTFYTMIMFDSFSNLTQNPGGGYLHWAKINIPCGDDLQAHGHQTGQVYGESHDSSSLSAGSFLPPGNPNQAPNNYGFYIFDQAGGKFRPTAIQHENFKSNTRHLPNLLRSAFEGVIDKGPIARNWAWLRVSHFSPSVLSSVGASEAAAKACASLQDTASPTCLPVSYGKLPPPPEDLERLFDIHQEMQEHELALMLGGHAGYKLGAVGKIEGEEALTGPLFKKVP